MTANANAAVVLAALNAALPAAVRAYELGKVPASRPDEYVETSVSRRAGDVQRGGLVSTVGYRVTVRAVSRVSVTNVRASLETCRAALEGERLTVGAGTTTPVQFESEDPAIPDEGWFSGLIALTYVL